jgi:hypothetical protein
MATWTTRSIRQRAAELLEERGWQPGAVGSLGPVGAEWAIAIVTGQAEAEGSPDREGPYLTTVRELEGLLVRESLLGWESRDGRTSDEVLVLLRDGRVAGGAPEPFTAEERSRRSRIFRRLIRRWRRQGASLRWPRPR